MVQLILSSAKGNQGLKYFPYVGYLGLTPIRVEGIVRTRLDADLKPLSASSLTVSVRCYESRVGRINTLQSNVLVDYTQILWSKSDALEHEPISNLEFPFRISIPAKVAGFSTAQFVDYRCVWRVEAVLNHVPIAGVGSRQIRHFDLPLIRYDLPPFSSITPSPEPMLGQEINKPRTPRLRYSIHPPKSPIGPLDLVSIPIHLHPLDHAVSIRSASVIVERRITLLDVPQQSASTTPIVPSLQQSHSSSSLSKALSPSPHLPSSSFPSASSSSSSSSSSSNPAYSHSYQDSEPVASTSNLSISSSNPTITPGTVYPSSASITSETPLFYNSINQHPSPLTQGSSSKAVVNPIAGAESSGHFSHDGRGTWTKTLTLQWPAAKSHSRWAIGETISSEIVSVKYFIRTKIVVTSPSGTETIELADQELLVVSTNDAERQLALAKYNELQDAMVSDGYSRSKSKSPRRSRPERDDSAIPPSPAPNSSLTTTATPYNNRTKSSNRRPHTSAGPRDKPVNFAGGAYGRPPRGQEGEATFGQASLGNGVGTGSGSGLGSTSTKRRSDVVVMRTTQRPDSKRGFLSGNGNGKLSSTSFWSTVHSNGVAPRVKAAPSGSSTSTTASSSSVSSSSHGGDSETSEHMREWEEELAKIEVKSRRSSDLLGFSGKRKRPGVARVIVPN
ncbi:hypothetical protein JR316_0003528 [Psilocybe cubensis]|uniref:Uncharacterized protein n=2 Tax=Psilocybe cubensis TaxID=181762 RepID=A0ACB8H8L2_PSICU|nr:hypothetical protein JR316_0003528 [Psilocybe cubensis]KAH9484049.1 hypothetical protein JR316_0003528 [Psilocybe cubensis]